MSTLIKGMEMPHNCNECRLCAFIPVGDYGIHRKCLPLNANAEITIRRVDCPLVPIQPHGRLIDADILAAKCDDPYWCVWLSDIDDTPTVIPAEPEEEETK